MSRDLTKRSRDMSCDLLGGGEKVGMVAAFL